MKFQNLTKMLDKNQIKNLIARGELKKALDLLPNIQEGLALKAQFSDLERKTMLGTISNSEAELTRNKIVASILQLIDMLDSEDTNTSTPPASPPYPKPKTSFTAIETAYKNADYVTVLELLDEHFGDAPTPQYSTLKQYIEGALIQGTMPTPAILQGLRLLINQLKKM